MTSQDSSSSVSDFYQAAPLENIKKSYIYI